MGRKSGKSYDFVDWQVTHVGMEDENPTTFDYPRPDPTDIGLSIRVHQVLGRGKFEHLEIAIYNQAFDEVVAMDLQPGESISFYGKYSMTKGRKQNFKKVSINLPKQVERHTGRPATPTEI